MRRVISIHEYQLKPGVDPHEFERALKSAQECGLLNLPGLVELHLVKGLRGDRQGRYAVVWIYKSRDAWEQLWGGVDNPTCKEAYPENWKTWENEVLAPYLDRDPDQITYTAYQEI